MCICFTRTGDKFAQQNLKSTLGPIKALFVPKVATKLPTHLHHDQKDRGGLILNNNNSPYCRYP